VAFSFGRFILTMTSEPTRNKGGRPFGTFGPRRRQQNLVDQYIAALGGSVTLIQERDICRAVLLESIAEQKRHELDGKTAPANEILALAKLEAVADAAVKRLRIPVTSLNTRVDT
jgi:hypothetical protein